MAHRDGLRDDLSAALAEPVDNSKESTKKNEKLLIAVFSEDKTSAPKLGGSSSGSNLSNQRQSILNRFASTDARLMPDKSQQQQEIPYLQLSATNNLPKIKCDNLNSVSPETKNNSAGEQSSVAPQDLNKLFSSPQEAPAKSEPVSDDDQVLPTWPTRMEAGSMRPAAVQHQVYSLKDYSQVAGPATKTMAPPTSASRLLKSMSQDRKVKSSTKRMSECIYSSSTQHQGSHFIGSTNDGSKQRNPSVANQITSASFSIGPATSVNSLLPQCNTKNNTLLSESRIDRVRKLFVSPLSLRNTSGSTTNANKSSVTTKHQESSIVTNSRLGFQSGANMLNKPHHLMHVMSRTRAGAHYSRRSPMRNQKCNGGKGFRVYGCPIQMANNIYPITCFGRPDIYKQQSVPYILARLCNYIEENSSQLTHEGIFRVSGNARLMEKLRTLFDRLGDAPLESESVDVATSASMLKMYLRELPEPLIPARMNYHFITLAKKYATLLSKDNISDFKAFDNAINQQPVSSRSSCEVSLVIGSENQTAMDRQRSAFLRDLTKLVRKLPIENYNLLKYLACFLYRISLKQQYNKMCAEALGIVFGPNVFRIRSESYKGLKEQELSNQIMASIISNYKSIFDCEITDPLGNFIKNTDDFRSIQSPPNDEKIHSNETAETSATIRLAGSPVPSTSNPSEVKICESRTFCSTDPADATHHHQKSCPTMERDFYSDNDDAGDEQEVADDDEESDADADDNDEEDCDDESYSPSSGSSYCSSMDSNSVESTYDEDDDDHDGRIIDSDQFEYADENDVDGDDEEDNFDISSECGTDTNYTPSSSHSDSDINGADESLYYRSSSFDSSPPAEGKETVLIDMDELQNTHELPIEQSGCRVCRRRESAQIEAAVARKVGQDLASKSSIPTVSCDQDVHAKSSDDDIIKYGKQRKLTPASDSPKPKKESDSRVGEQIPHRIHNKSMRRNKATISKAANETTKQKLAFKTTIDHDLNQVKARLIGTHLQPINQTNKANLLRRRSSSASSLYRIKRKHDHAADKKATDHRDGHYHHYKTKSSNSERRKSHGTRLYNRKSRNKSQMTRKSAHHLKTSGSTKRTDDDKDRNFDDLINDATSTNKGMGGKFILDLMSNTYLELPVCGRLYQIRSYNSDETLFRSIDYNEFNDSIEATKTGRRFSDHEHLQTASRILTIGQTFEQIFETTEAETMIEGRPKTISNSLSNRIGTSMICLLDNSDKLDLCKLSTISVSEILPYEDEMKNSMWLNLRALQRLIWKLKQLKS